MKNAPATVALVIGAAAWAACTAGPLAAPGEPAAHESPAGPGSGEPFLASARDGSVLMSWLEAGDSAHELRFARFDGERWSEPAVITASSLFFVNWADFPSILQLSDGRLASHWLGRSGPGRYAYDVWVSFSTDEGRRWSPPVRPHRDGTQTEHGFVTLFETAAGAAALWLDGREYAAADANGGERGAMTLRWTPFNGDGEPAAEMLVDPRVCDCCQTDVAVAGTVPVAVFRDRSPSEVRDISVTRLVDGQWTEPTPVHEDNWTINACPVNGPAIAAHGDLVAVAWFTAAADTPRVNVAWSGNGGVAFERPVRVDLGDPLGRVDVVLLQDGTSLVTWLERKAEGARVLARRVARDGRTSDILTVGESDAGRPSGFPRVTESGGRLYFAWTVPDPPARIRFASAPLPGR